MANILLIDTSSDTGTIAICNDGKLLSVKYQPDNRNHAATINLLINEVLKDAQISFAQLSGIAVCAGPGSYTGLRIGVSTAKGLCYALNIPLMLHNKLFLLGRNAILQHNAAYSYYLPLLHARENEYFIALYNNNFTEVVAPTHVHASEMADITSEKHNIFITGSNEINIVKQLHENITETGEQNNINIDMWAEYANQQYNCNVFVNLSTAEPFYLKQVYTHK